MLYRVVTCLPCGYRESVAPGGRHTPTRCPNDGSQLEHADVDLRRRDARLIESSGRDTRRPREMLRQLR